MFELISNRKYMKSFENSEIIARIKTNHKKWWKLHKLVKNRNLFDCWKENCNGPILGQVYLTACIKYNLQGQKYLSWKKTQVIDKLRQTKLTGYWPQVLNKYKCRKVIYNRTTHGGNVCAHTQAYLLLKSFYINFFKLLYRLNVIIIKIILFCLMKVCFNHVMESLISNRSYRTEYESVP